MTYRKVEIQLIPDNQEYRDILMATLGEIGFESFVENERNIEAYITDNTFNVQILNTVDFQPLFSFSCNHELIPDQNWNEVWEKNYFKPLLIADKCLIRAPFHTDYPKAKYEIVIEPKMAFGTGNHETTSLMIEHLIEASIEDLTLLDMGCGTGILSMLASMKGAKSITAIDIDQWAFENTIENCDQNKCKNVKVFKGDASLIGKETFDIILANIHKNVLIEDLDKYCSVLNANGTLILSGFYENDLTDISNKAAELGLGLLKTKTKNKWIAASFTNFKA